ncbi:MAG: hypothetical protein II914_09580 [Clostridia bacterium]|nr:hypothetical protein [Clostridia bacterium]
MKKIVALLLAVAMVFALAACAKSTAPAQSEPAPAAAAPAAAAPAEPAAAPAEPATGSLKIWVAEAVVEFTKEQVANSRKRIPSTQVIPSR